MGLLDSIANFKILTELLSISEIIFQVFPGRSTSLNFVLLREGEIVLLWNLVLYCERKVCYVLLHSNLNHVTFINKYK
jgi:hypothetical protein